jgi:hypothetical protein
MAQGFFGSIGNTLGGIGSKLGGVGGKLGNALNTIRTSDIGKTYDIYKTALGQGMKNVGAGVKEAFTNPTQFQSSHPVMSGVGNALLGGGMEYLGQKLNEPYRHNLITASYYGNRYTPHLEKPDEQWGQKMTQGIQGLMMGKPVDPNKEKEEEQPQQQQPQQQGDGDEDDDEEKAAKERAAFYSINSTNYSPVEFNPLNSYSGRYA